MESTAKRYQAAKKYHKIACGGTFMTQTEFVTEPEAEQKSFVQWLKDCANDVKREERLS